MPCQRWLGPWLTERQADAGTVHLPPGRVAVCGSQLCGGGWLQQGLPPAPRKGTSGPRTSVCRRGLGQMQMRASGRAGRTASHPPGGRCSLGPSIHLHDWGLSHSMAELDLGSF